MQEKSIQEKDLFYNKIFNDNSEEQVQIWAKEYYLLQQAYIGNVDHSEKSSLENQKEALALGIDSLLLWSYAYQAGEKEKEDFYRQIAANMQALHERLEREKHAPNKIASIQEKLLVIHHQVNKLLAPLTSKKSI